MRKSTGTFVLAALMTAFFIPAGSNLIAATTDVVRHDSFSDLQDGEMEGVAISSNGYLYPSYGRTEIGDTGAEIVWAAIPGAKDTVLAATGHDGKLVRLGGKDSPQVVADLEEPELTAMTALADGSVLVAAAPSGRIYKLATDDKVTTYTQLEAKFVWNMATDEKGNVWAATGTEGKLFKISPNGDKPKVETAIDLASQNIIDLWIDNEGLMGEKGAIYIAGQNPAWLYRYKDGDKKATVVYNAGSDEIRDIHPLKDGLAIASNTERAPSPQVLNLTLRMAGAPPSGRPDSGGGSPPAGSPGGDDKSMGDVFSASPKKPSSPSSNIILLTPDGFARELWTSPERPIHSLSATPEGNLLIAAGGKGRVFELMSPKDFALVADVKEDYIVSIAQAGDGWLMTSARNGVAFRMTQDRPKEAVYRSKIIDASTPVQWGRFHWHGQQEDGQEVVASFRTGNTDDPETDGWSEWSRDSEVTNSESAEIPGPPSRYMQYRLTFKQGRRSNPALKTDFLETFYRQPNRPPQVTEISVTDTAAPRSGSEASSGSSRPTPSPRSSSSSSSSSESSSSSGSDTPAQGGGRAPHSNTQNITVSWSASDPNNDDLIYALYFKANDETEWKLIDDEIRTTRMPLGVSGVGDGRYRFRGVASDKLQNPPGEGLETELISDEIVIDNTPPVIDDLRVRVDDNKARVTAKVRDNLSLLSSIVVDIDGGDGFPIYSADGLYDERAEEVDWMTLSLEPGEHVLTIAVTDRRGNTVVQKQVFRVGR